MRLDFTPASNPAPRAERIIAHATTEAKLTLGNGEQLLLALVIPVGLLVAGVALGPRWGLDARTWPASVMALAGWSTSFTSLAITTGFERRYGVLERLAATPLSRFDLLAGKALATLLIAAGQAALLATIAFSLGWRPIPGIGGWAALLVGVPLAIFVFANLALLLAGTLRAEVTLALANLVYLVGALAGVVVAADSLPAPWSALVALLPTAALGTISRAWATGTTDLAPLLVLLGWAIIVPLLCRKVFRWMS